MKVSADLDRIYLEAEKVDKKEFAEMRSSLKLVSGDHYHRDNSGFSQIRTSQAITSDNKLRLTKNHIGKIARRYANHIVSAAPGVKCSPKHDKEIQDQKSAELNQSVWTDVKERNDYKTWVDEWADDFGNIGEVHVKLFFDAEKKFIGFEDLYAFNILRCPSAKSIKKSPYLIIRKMVSTSDLKATFADFAEKINSGKDETFMVFQNGEYRESNEKETMLREFYYKPCAQYPNGYYYIQACNTVLDEGDLPGGIFPIVSERFEYVQTKARGVSLTKPLRPYQLEVNRTASKIAETQVTLGDDKLIMQNGSKLSAGATLPGVRGITVTGQPPIVMAGRSGEQYVDYMLKQIAEMYQVADVQEDDDLPANLDPTSLLFRAASQKKKFSRYISRFESFLKRVCETTLEMARLYYDEDACVMAVGQNERVNIAEFKSTSPQAVSIVIEPQSEDIETKLGRQIVMTNILQYVGSAMDPSSIGKMIKNLPYANLDESFSDLTMDYEVATNLILALDRGESVDVFPFDKNDYIVSRLSKRMSEPDFKFKHDYIKGLYQDQIDQRMVLMQEQKETLQRANSGFIPDGGALVGVDYFVQDANNPGRTRRARIPYAALDWLVRKLEEQGTFKKEAMQVPDEVIAAESSRLSHTSDVPQAQGANAEIVDPTVAGAGPGMGLLP